MDGTFAPMGIIQGLTPDCVLKGFRNWDYFEFHYSVTVFCVVYFHRIIQGIQVWS